MKTTKRRLTRTEKMLNFIMLELEEKLCQKTISIKGVIQELKKIDINVNKSDVVRIFWGV